MLRVEGDSGREGSASIKMTLDVAQTTQLQGSDEKAGHLYARAIEIFGNTLGPDHPFVIRTLSKWARLLVAQVSKPSG